MPRAHDQPDNAERLIRMGVAGKLEPKRYKAAKVAGKLRMLLGSADVKSQCETVAGRFVGVDPIRETCDLIEELVNAERTTVVNN